MPYVGPFKILPLGIEISAPGFRRCVITAALYLLTSVFCAAVSTNQTKLTSANSAFAFKLLTRLAQDQPGTNIFISPYSASTVLQMVCNGAAGQTRSEMMQVLGTTGLQPDALNEAVKATHDSLNSRNTNVLLTTANAIWYQKGALIKPDFLTCNQRFFGATVDALDFNDPHSVDIMNTWANEETHGRISRIADGIVDPLTNLILANAVYFKGAWEMPFEEKLTKTRTFHLRGGRQKKTPMMEQTRDFSYRRGTGYQAVGLTYKGYNLEMNVFLPDVGSSPEKLLGIMNGSNWQRVTRSGFRRREGTVVLPRFKFEYDVELKKSLQLMGMRKAFEKADFSTMSEQPLFISAVRQQTCVEVNEKGTEAAAATMVALPCSDLGPQKPFKMIVDRPFLFFIMDNGTGTILFMGIVHDPQAD